MLNYSPPRFMESKILYNEQARKKYIVEYLDMKSQLTKKDKIIEYFSAKSRMNARELKKFKEAYAKFIRDRFDFLTRCTHWQNACSSCACDLQVCIKFMNQADEHEKEAESRVRYLEAETRKLSEELQAYKQQLEVEHTENMVIDELITTLINKDEVASTSHSFLEANSDFDACQKMLKIFDALNPSTHNILALASEVKKLQKERDILRTNLIKAEEEVTFLFDENNSLDTENTILTDLIAVDLSRIRI